MNTAKRWFAIGVLLLLALQFLWHVRLQPPQAASPWLVASLFSLPLWPSLLLLARGRPSARFWGGVAALFYFCHGIMEAWTLPQERALGLAETALAILVIVAGSWAGMRARFSGRSKPPSNV